MTHLHQSKVALPQPGGGQSPAQAHFPGFRLVVWICSSVFRDVHSEKEKALLTLSQHLL
jgi:hypothetical protein